MKLLTLLLLLSTSFTLNAGTPVEVKIPVDKIYVPTGFDENDNSEIIISGWLPNLCHKSPSTEVELKGRTIVITVTALRYDATNPFCPEMPPMVVPFLESVSIGLLKEGSYKIIINAKTQFEKKSNILILKSKNTAIDDHIYANVYHIEREPEEQSIILKGYNPSDCLVLKEVKFISNGLNAYSVLPIMEKVRDFCPMKMIPFSYQVDIPTQLKHHKILLHVRKMDGNSVNSIFYKQ